MADYDRDLEALERTKAEARQRERELVAAAAAEREEAELAAIEAYWAERIAAEGDNPSPETLRARADLLTRRSGGQPRGIAVEAQPASVAARLGTI